MKVTPSWVVSIILVVLMIGFFYHQQSALNEKGRKVQLICDQTTVGSPIEELENKLKSFGHSASVPAEKGPGKEPRPAHFLICSGGGFNCDGCIVDHADGKVIANRPYHHRD